MTLCPASDPGQGGSGNEKAMSGGRNVEPGLEGLSGPGKRPRAVGSTACQPLSHAQATCTPHPTHSAPQRPHALNVWLLPFCPSSPWETQTHPSNSSDAPCPASLPLTHDLLPWNLQQPSSLHPAIYFQLLSGHGFLAGWHHNLSPGLSTEASIV